VKTYKKIGPLLPKLSWK